MYAAGNLPDHVTRYNHKRNRWMPESAPVRSNASEAATVALCAVCFAIALALGVMILQGVRV